MLPTPLQPLAAWPQFIVWRLEKRPNAQGVLVDVKVPYSPVHGGLASTTNPADWGTLADAEDYVHHMHLGMSGIGFVLTERDPFVFLDIDAAWDGQAWSATAAALCARCAGAAVEVSQSGTGLHIIASGAAGLAGIDHRNKTDAKRFPFKLELYTKERFVALTGTNAVGSAATDLSAVWPAIAAEFFKREPGTGVAAEWTTGPVPEWSGPADDGELLERALRSGGQASAAQAFGGDPARLTFADLFSADPVALGARFPGQGAGAPYDASAADQSFANMLAFWTGKDCARIERIMRMSALSREKWDNHATYLETTILKACGTVGEVYAARVDPGPAPSRVALDAAGISPRAGGGLMLYHQEVDHFAGCVYVTAINKILTPRGTKLDQARFDAVYGGFEFVVSVDGKKTTRSAWEAFTRNENFPAPTADRLCFRPEAGSGGLLEEGGEILANSYVAIDVPTAEGDPGPFLDLMRRQIPDEGDRAILLNYMASVAQNPGMKAQWWPVLQGLKGNGKTVYLSIMEYVVGAKYAHLPAVGKLLRNGMNFNGWIEGKLFLGLEEIKGAQKREFFEEFKTTVTNRRLAIEGKGIEEVTGDNRANGMLTTNHQDGVPLEPDERRYAVFFMAQQKAGDLVRDGMTPAYFADFHDWFYGRNAYAARGVNWGLRVLAGYLKGYQTKAELDPARLAIWAPVTTSTAAAIQTSRGRVEQEVQEAIEEGRVGFAGGWVSSTYLGRLLDGLRVGMAPNRRRELMVSLGYDYHPALGPQGRVNNPVQPDGGKPRLYLKAGHLARNIEAAADVAKAYTKAQSAAVEESTAAAFAKG